MNKISQNWIQKHSTLTSAASVILLFIGIKVAHIVPLKGLQEKFVQDLKENAYNLGPISEEFLRLDPRKTHVVTFGNDTLIIQDATRQKTFTLTCPLEQEYCLLRDNPYTIQITGTVFGSGESIPKESLSEEFRGYDMIRPRTIDSV